MKYINKITKAVIETASICSGGDWIPFEEEKTKEEKPKPTRKKSANKKVSE